MAHDGLMSKIHEVGVVGVGPTGLQATLTLRPMYVATFLLDDARYRSAVAAQMHNVLGWDDATPAAVHPANGMRTHASADIAAPTDTPHASRHTKP